MWAAAVERWRDLVLDELRLAGSQLNPELVLALISQESGGDTTVNVRAGGRATGLMQVTTAGRNASLTWYNNRHDTTITPAELDADPRLEIRVGLALLDHYRNQVDVQLFAGRRATTPLAQVIRAQLTDHAYAEGMGALGEAVAEWRTATGKTSTPTSLELQALHPTDPPPWARNHVWRHRNQVVGKAVAFITAAGGTLTWSPRTGTAPIVPTPPAPDPTPLPVPPVPPAPEPEKKKLGGLIVGAVLGVLGLAAVGYGLANV